jgi:Fe-S cluster assembly protein SufD
MSRDALSDLRARGQAEFERLGLPSRKIEAWHYTDLSKLDLAAYRLAEPPPPAEKRPNVIHLIDGFLAAAGPLPAGVTLERLDSSADGQGRVGKILPSADLPLVGLNGGLFTDGLVLRVAKGARIETPIRLISEGGAETQFHGRLLLLLEEGASLTLVETHRGDCAYVSNWVAEIGLSAGASLHHVTLQDEAPDSTHIATLGLDLAEKSVYRGVLLQLGGHLARHEIHAMLSGAGADFALDGASLALGRQHLDNTTRIIHRAPSCQSRQLFKTVLDQEGHGVFQGTVLVERPAQKTNAYQLSRALMLSDRAAMDNKPELEIFADDVKCGHGATIGDIDENQLFYLRARGIDEKTARRLLIEAFLEEVVEQISCDSVREELDALLLQRLAMREGA